MWWLRTTCALGLCFLVGCGSDSFEGQNGSDQTILSFQRFTGEGIDQADAVGNTSADVDICPSFCFTGGLLTDFETETYTATRINAVFVNREKADILLDRYGLSFPGRTDIPPKSYQISALIPGGRCDSNRQQACAFDSDCGDGVCEHQETSVEFLLYDFVTKELLRGDGECPSLDLVNFVFNPGDILPQTLETVLFFSGSDQTGQRLTISTGYVGTFTDFNNCPSSSE